MRLTTGFGTAKVAIARFFADLEGAGAAKFYRPVGAIGRLFVDIETRAFALPD